MIPQSRTSHAPRRLGGRGRVVLLAGALALAGAFWAPAGAEEERGIVCTQLQNDLDSLALDGAKAVAELGRTLKEIEVVRSLADRALSNLGGSILNDFEHGGSVSGSTPLAQLTGYTDYLEKLEDATARARALSNKLSALSAANQAIQHIFDTIGCGDILMASTDGGGGSGGGPGSGKGGGPGYGENGGQTGGGEGGGLTAGPPAGWWHDTFGHDVTFDGTTFYRDNKQALVLTCAGATKSKNGSDGIACTGDWYDHKTGEWGGHYKGVYFMRQGKTPYIEGAYTWGDDERYWEWNFGRYTEAEVAEKGLH